MWNEIELGEGDIGPRVDSLNFAPDVNTKGQHIDVVDEDEDERAAELCPEEMLRVTEVLRSSPQRLRRHFDEPNQLLREPPSR